MKFSGRAEGRPVRGSRACRCRIAAPASAAPMDCSAIWSGVTGRCGDMDGVWIDPVMAQERMILAMGQIRSVMARSASGAKAVRAVVSFAMISSTCASVAVMGGQTRK